MLSISCKTLKWTACTIQYDSGARSSEQIATIQSVLLIRHNPKKLVNSSEYFATTCLIFCVFFLQNTLVLFCFLFCLRLSSRLYLRSSLWQKLWRDRHKKLLNTNTNIYTQSFKLLFNKIRSQGTHQEIYARTGTKKDTSETSLGVCTALHHR